MPSQEEILEQLKSDPRILSSHSLIHFGATYFKHLVTDAPCEFHYELTDTLSEIILNPKRKIGLPHDNVKQEIANSFNALAAPRGFAKTTWALVILSCWIICYEYKNYMINISSAAANAEGVLENIKFELTENKLLMKSFPNACGVGPVWRQNMIITRNGIRIDALGSGQQVRGRNHHGNRPDFIVLDDVETDENINTPEQREKLLRWFDRAVAKAGGTNTDIFVVGTVLHTESLLATLLNRPGYSGKKYRAIINWADRRDLWDQWAKIFHDPQIPKESRMAACLDFFTLNRKEMLRGTEVLWPDRWDYYTLMVEFERDGAYAFASERQNDPTEGDSLVTMDEIQGYEPSSIRPELLEFIVGGVDPSLGKNKKSDYSAIIHVGLDDSGVMYVLNASIARRRPDSIILDIIDFAKRVLPPWRWPLRNDRFLVETVAFQEFFKTTLDKVSLDNHAYLPTEEVNVRANKRVRISFLQPMIRNGYIKFRKDGTQATLIEQLVQYPHGKDDGPDCLAMIVKYITDNASHLAGSVVVPMDFGYQYGTF